MDSCPCTVTFDVESYENGTCHVEATSPSGATFRADVDVFAAIVTNDICVPTQLVDPGQSMITVDFSSTADAGLPEGGRD